MAYGWTCNNCGHTVSRRPELPDNSLCPCETYCQCDKMSSPPITELIVLTPEDLKRIERKVI